MWETNRSLCRDPYISSQGFESSQSPFIFIITQEHSVCVLADHQPVNHQEIERLDIGEITEAITVNTVKAKEHCAQTIISELEDQRAQITSPESNTVVVEVEIHAESNDAQHMVHFEEAQDISDAGSLITQAPQSNPIHATINALSTWMSAIQPRESWYLAGWTRDSPIHFLVDPGAVVSTISLQCYEKTCRNRRYTYAYEGHANRVGSCQQVRYESTWDVQLRIISAWITN